jgi:hypothetical protein
MDSPNAWPDAVRARASAKQTTRGMAFILTLRLGDVLLRTAEFAQIMQEQTAFQALPEG